MPKKLTPSLPKTLGELKANNWRSRSVKDELRENLLKKIRSGKTREEPLFSGIIGYEASVEKSIINAILAKHNFIFLGLRGQGKTKLIRSLINFLDQESPIIQGSHLNEDPLNPISPWAKRLIQKKKDLTPIEWVSREERFKEKLATPDVSISDLIGDIDPIKAAREKLDISNEEVIHWGIIPRSNRGIFAINELPDLQARIQVGLFNILEENDVQIRGFPLRLPLDILLVFSANPEDYTNRGRIITPLKDRISSEIITHYPVDLEVSKQITLSQVTIPEEVVVPELVLELVERITFISRENEFIDKLSGVSQRLSISILELVIANAVRRRALLGKTKSSEKEFVRVLDLYSGIAAITGKIELVEDLSPEETKNLAIHLISEAINEVFKEIFPKVDSVEAKPNQGFEQDKVENEEEKFKGSDGRYEIVLEYFRQGNELKINDEMDEREYYSHINKISQLQKIVAEYIKGKREDNNLYAEVVLEGLHFQKVINRNIFQGEMKFFDQYSNMFKSW